MTAEFRPFILPEGRYLSGKTCHMGPVCAGMDRRCQKQREKTLARESVHSKIHKPDEQFFRIVNSAFYMQWKKKFPLLILDILVFHLTVYLFVLEEGGKQAVNLMVA